MGLAVRRFEDFGLLRMWIRMIRIWGLFGVFYLIGIAEKSFDG